MMLFASLLLLPSVLSFYTIPYQYHYPYSPVLHQYPPALNHISPVPQQYPPGVDPLLCPDYPFCHKDPIITKSVESLKVVCAYGYNCIPLEGSDNQVTGDAAAEAAEDGASCQKACLGNPSCAHFTFTKYIGVARCRLLKTCTRAQRKPRCSRPDRCESGPKSCQCQKLAEQGDGQTDWKCKKSDGSAVTKPYEQTANEVGTVCTASCNSGQTITSTCGPTGTWTNTETLTRASWPTPDQGSVTCPKYDCQPLTISANNNPNSQEDGELLCDGKNPGLGEIKVQPIDICTVKCHGETALTFSCLADGSFSSEGSSGPKKIVKSTDIKCYPDIKGCNWKEWTAWSACSEECEGGEQERTREGKSFGGGECSVEEAKETRACNSGNTESCVGKAVVIQRRGQFENPESYFYRGWTEYENGFGDKEEEFWLGLQKISSLTAKGTWKLVVVLKDLEGKEFIAVYDDFKVDATKTYNLRIAGFNSAKSNVLDKLTYHDGMAFSTKDRDNDENSGNCATKFLGAWWYKNCLDSNLNGYNYNSDSAPSHKGIYWPNGGKYSATYSWPSVEMKMERTA